MPSGTSAPMDAARRIMAGETEIMIAAGVDDMEKVAMGANMDFPPRLFLKIWSGDTLRRFRKCQRRLYRKN